MNRVPKFRAWDKKEEKMMMVQDLSWSYDNNDDLYLLGIGDSITFWKDADEIELMQSTGLKDKNGVEIFEKDIVLRVLNEKGVKTYGIVEYIDGMYLVDGIEGLNSHDWLIIGNIYENRQLLKAERF